MTWLSGDLRLMVLFWGATLVGLTLLIRLNSAWQVASEADQNFWPVIFVKLVFFVFCDDVDFSCHRSMATIIGCNK